MLFLDSDKPGAKQLFNGTGHTPEWPLNRELCMQRPLAVLRAGWFLKNFIKDVVPIINPLAVEVCSAVNWWTARQAEVSSFYDLATSHTPIQT